MSKLRLRSHRPEASNPRPSIMRYQGLALLMSVLSLAMLSGCGSEANDPAVLAQRAKFLLNDDPGNAQLVPELREEMESNAAQDSVAIKVKIGGVSDPWSKGRAGFVVIDPDTDHAANCQDVNCEHCRRLRDKKRFKGTALVEFVQDGQVVPIDARTLLGVKQGDLVVVRGRPKLNEDNLVIEADGLYICQ